MAAGEDETPDAARKLYPSMYGDAGATKPAQADQQGRGTNAPAEPSEGAEADADGDGGPSAAEKLYGQGGDAVSEGVARAALDQAFNPVEMDAREQGDIERAEDLAALRSGLAGLASEFGIDQPAMRELGIAGAQYQEPASDDQLEAGHAQAEAALRREHGADFDKVVEGIQRVTAEAIAKEPRLRDWLENGAGNDPRVINAAVRAARQRGYI